MITEAIENLPTVTLEAIREEAMMQCPEWQDVGKLANRELTERRYENEQRHADG